MAYTRPRIVFHKGSLATDEDLQVVERDVETWSNGGWLRRIMQLPKHMSDELTRRGHIRMADDDSDEISIRLPPNSRR